MTCAASSILAIALPATAWPDTTVPITGIGTSLSGVFTIDTHVESVTYSDPQVVAVEGFGRAVEIRGTVSGVGWGGGGILARASNAHYSYQIPFVARWAKQGVSRDVVVHHHGGGVTLMAAIMREKQVGAENPNRRAEFASDLAAGLPALLNGCTYIATNRRGFRHDGSFSATYLPGEVPPLIQAEADSLQATIAGFPGEPGFQQPGIEAGAPVALVPTQDAPTCRDIARALLQVVAGIKGTPFRTRIYSGHSSGARLGASLDFGRTVIGAASERTGGNHVLPYAPLSPRIFDGFVLTGFTYDTNADRADAAQPISAPVVFIQGRGDERYQQTIRMAHELHTRGVPLNRWLRIYEVKGLSHVTRDLVPETVQPSNGDLLGSFVSPAFRNMIEWINDGRKPPQSRIAGRILNDALVIDQAGGLTTTQQPILEDPAIDSLQVDALLVVRTIGPDETARWKVVTAALAHKKDAITPPTIACRVGGYRIKFFAAERNAPFSPVALETRYKSYRKYRAQVEKVVAKLVAARLYDDRVESAGQTAELARWLFLH